MVHHILVAHDLSPEADVALQRAAALAKQTGAQLSLLHVLHEKTESVEAEHVRGDLQARLDVLGLESQLWLRKGEVVEELLTQASGLEADVLVVGRHHSQQPQGFAGTTLERILLACPMPLLLAVTPPTPYRHALAALDYSRCASRALQSGWQLLPSAAELTALYVHEVAEVHGTDPAEQALQKELFEQLVDDLRVSLGGGARLTSVVRYGERANCLDAVIAEQGPDLLTLGGHSRGEISSTLLGSLTREYLDHPPCDVLIAH
jgi:nucleotide-binding universal stress UspA family protein